jgi:predicted metalloprotease with PDZ domain
LKKSVADRAVRAAGLALTMGLTGAVAYSAPIPAPEDKPYPGDIRLSVDASDNERRIVRIHETISGVGPDTVLLYPQWLPGNHAPSGPIERLAGLTITANGTTIAWSRDPTDVFAFHVQVPADVHSIDVDYQYLSPPSAKIGRSEIGHNVMILDWNEFVLYPAGYYTQQIAVQPTLTLPMDWKYASALEPALAGSAQLTVTPFNRLPLDTLIDSPVYAGRYYAQLDLDPGAAVPVHLNLFAERADQLVVKPEQLQAHRALVQQAYKLFGSHHYSHYDFLYSLSDDVAQKGLEHHQSTEVGASPNLFADWDRSASERDLLPHEFTHSWNGKFRRPADLWTPNFNVPMRGSLLWVYEGQTQYWGHVLAARSGLVSRQQALDLMAMTAAYYETQPGRRWRALQDTTTDEIMNPRRPMPWRDWQRFEDYYNEGMLIWLDVDTLIRERSGGKRSLDDFARAFFGIHDGSFVTLTYTFDDVVTALNAVAPYDWATFLHHAVDTIGAPPPLSGVHRGGYRLVYSDTPSDYERASDAQHKRNNQTFSIGLDIDTKDNSVAGVVWDGPAFRASMTEGDVILAVNGESYDSQTLDDAIRKSKGNQTPIELIVRNGEHYKVVDIDYHDGLRYPHLVRDAIIPARLDDILSARK